MSRESLSALGCVSLCTLSWHMPKGHIADGQQICINLAVCTSSVGPASNTQHGNDWSVRNWSIVINTCTRALGFGAGRLERLHFQRAGGMEWLSFWERTAKYLNTCVAVAFVWKSLCLTLSPWTTRGSNFTRKHLQLQHSGFPWNDCDGVVCS